MRILERNNYAILYEAPRGGYARSSKLLRNHFFFSQRYPNSLLLWESKVIAQHRQGVFLLCPQVGLSYNQAETLRQGRRLLQHQRTKMGYDVRWIDVPPEDMDMSDAELELLLATRGL